MVRRNPEDKLKIEGIELSDKEPDDETNYCNPPLKTWQGVPGELNPSMRWELAKEPPNLTPVGGDLVEPPPVVGLHAEIPECVNAKYGASTIADDYIQNPMIPPKNVKKRQKKETYTKHSKFKFTEPLFFAHLRHFHPNLNPDFET